MNFLLKNKGLALLLALLLLAPAAFAGVSYQLDTTRVEAGQTLTISGVAFNDDDKPISWTAPEQLPVTWQDASGKRHQLEALLQGAPAPATLAPGKFKKRQWVVRVPEHIQGLQTLAIDTHPTLIAVQADDPARPIPAFHADNTSAVAAGGGTTTAAASSAPFEYFRRAISPYNPIYFDVGGRNGTNARFQISLKYRLFSPDDPARPAWYDHLYLGYTQTSLWDLDSRSKPFVDSTYNPSAFWHNPHLIGGERSWSAGLATGVEHKSNGKSGADSRSLNEAYIQPELNYQFDGGSVLTFMPRAKVYFSKKENPDYAQYMGHVDWKLRWAQPNGLILTGLYRQGERGRTSTQLEAAWPLKRTFLNMNGFFHVQYFKGYGETLLGYDQKSDGQVRIGIALVP